jgi:hypothetical protein
MIVDDITGTEQAAGQFAHEAARGRGLGGEFQVCCQRSALEPDCTYRRAERSTALRFTFSLAFLAQGVTTYQVPDMLRARAALQPRSFPPQIKGDLTRSSNMSITVSSLTEARASNLSDMDEVFHEC